MRCQWAVAPPWRRTIGDTVVRDVSPTNSSCHAIMPRCHANYRAPALASALHVSAICAIGGQRRTQSSTKRSWRSSTTSCATTRHQKRAARLTGLWPRAIRWRPPVGSSGASSRQRSTTSSLSIGPLTSPRMWPRSSVCRSCHGKKSRLAPKSWPNTPSTLLLVPLIELMLRRSGLE